MSRNIADVTLDDLPSEVPLFPLPGALLLPRGRIPLNIFEPRYLAMIEDALARGRMIGMIQPKDFALDPVPNHAPLFAVGCLGRITSFSETDDGRFAITVTGLCRFRLAEEVEGRGGYRRAHVDFRPFARDMDVDNGTLDDRNRLMVAVKSFFDTKDIKADFEIMEKASDEALVTALAMVCPLDAREKQGLLECGSVTERGDMLTALLEMATHGNGDTGPRLRH